MNGTTTIDEIIADIGGIRAAFGAYQTFKRKEGEEDRLPGLKYTSNQLFFISFAQVRKQCNYVNAKSLAKHKRKVLNTYPMLYLSLLQFMLIILHASRVAKIYNIFNFFFNLDILSRRELKK